MFIETNSLVNSILLFTSVYRRNMFIFRLFWVVCLFVCRIYRRNIVSFIQFNNCFQKET